MKKTEKALTRIFHQRSGESLNYPIIFSFLEKNQDDFHRDKVYQRKDIITSMPGPNC